MTTLVEHARQVLPLGLTGRIDRVVGLTAAVVGFPAPLGSRCTIDRDHGLPIEADVVGFRGDETLLMPLGELTGVRRGARVRLVESVPCVNVGAGLLGRIIGSRGEFLDEGPKPLLAHRADLHGKPPGPLERPRIAKIWQTGVRAIDGLLTLGEGQRMGIFAGSGVGKSTLLGQIARHSSADINVVALIGERGREVREFLDRDLGPEGLKRSVVIVATGDEPAILRLRAAWMATAIAEHFRDLGQHVVLMMDSVTRFALAQREIGLAAGEPPQRVAIHPVCSPCCLAYSNAVAARQQEVLPGCIPCLSMVTTRTNPFRIPSVGFWTGILCSRESWLNRGSSRRLMSCRVFRDR